MVRTDLRKGVRLPLCADECLAAVGLQLQPVLCENVELCGVGGDAGGGVDEAGDGQLLALHLAGRPHVEGVLEDELEVALLRAGEGRVDEDVMGRLVRVDHGELLQFAFLEEVAGVDLPHSDTARLGPLPPQCGVAPRRLIGVEIFVAALLIGVLVIVTHRPMEVPFLGQREVALLHEPLQVTHFGKLILIPPICRFSRSRQRVPMRCPDQPQRLLSVPQDLPLPLAL
mmetsp:Transcript_14350/g.41251  ORF Transcript_14350/g.41251 Transcript_14350/m.41251 type:complete len:228 (+) Transcript_14350:1247-1930(+)